MGKAGTGSTVERTLSTIAFMKDCRGLDDLATKSLVLEMSDESRIPAAYLVPIGSLHASDESVVEKLTAWRAAHQYAYPSRFSVTEEGTKKWLADAVVENSHRLLFLVTDNMLRPLGHLGLLLLPNGELEIDNVLRGESKIPGLMRTAMRALESWALSELDAQSVSLRVLASNARAIVFYGDLGYETVEHVPLKWVGAEVDGRLVPTDDNPDDEFLVMAKDVQAAQPAQAQILTAGPLIGAREATHCLDATRTGWNARHSDYLGRFEREFADYVGSEYAIATSSCTGALHLALLACGIGEGDEVIVPESTWVATASAVAYTGAIPIFADVDPATWTLSVDSVRSLISARTRAIIPVHLYGYACDMDPLLGLAQEFGLRIVEDAAPAIGTLVGTRAAGSLGDIGCFSFQGAKMLVTGEGGMLVTNDKELYRRAWKQQDHGRVPGTFWIDEVGRKYKMSNLTAALGLGQLQTVETQIAKKRRVNGWYMTDLVDVPGVSFQMERPGSRSICWMTSLTLAESTGRGATELAEHLRTQGIDSRPVFPPISSYPIWGRASRSGDVGRNAATIASNSLNLPSGVRLSRSSVSRVTDAIIRFLDS